MAKVNQKGRTKGYRPFVMLRHDLMDSSAYRSLSPADRAVYMQVLRRYNGNNNGDIPLSCREAGELCNISDATASRAFKALQDRGFLSIGRASGFNMKTRMSTRWILTHHALDKNIAPSNEWRDWGKKQNTVSLDTPTVSGGTP